MSDSSAKTTWVTILAYAGRRVTVESDQQCCHPELVPICEETGDDRLYCPVCTGVEV